MASWARAFGPHAPEQTYVAHDLDELVFDTGEVRLNYATAGRPESPALLLVPGQTESWWGYEAAMHLLAERFHVFAVDLRGQGRSTRTPGRYTLDNIGNDLVRFIAGAVGRPTVVAGLSSGGLIATWLAAYAMPGQVLAAYLEDPPLFASEVRPETGPGLDQTIGPVWALLAKYLGPQWSIGDWDGLAVAAPLELPPRLAMVAGFFGIGGDPPQTRKESDPEWAQAFSSGSFSASCPHVGMLAAVRVPVMFSHHFRVVDAATGVLMGAISDVQVARVQELIAAGGNEVQYHSLPTMGHNFHAQDPAQYADLVVSWAGGLGLLP